MDAIQSFSPNKLDTDRTSPMLITNSVLDWHSEIFDFSSFSLARQQKQRKNPFRPTEKL